MDSPVEAGEVADEVRQKGGAPAEGAKKQLARLMKNLFFVILILPLALPGEVDSPVSTGEVADEVRQKGGAPAEGA